MTFLILQDASTVDEVARAQQPTSPTSPTSPSSPPLEEHMYEETEGLIAIALYDYQAGKTILMLIFLPTRFSVLWLT